ncbi:hypothetical protein MHY30_01765 [Microbacterium sp. ACRRU]|jgi:GGDEF domain-containing protein|uniref:hypothetical protein n=1 Tax=Microbacterium sp. ACRRU TaxID=2918204 RepID=UPI001EF56940|nr:hypothetical protein [Microbacterium sp. ACRRU]MCG7416236.1 hypothetical protein [Microbacterium sp. ACRRU]
MTPQETLANLGLAQATVATLATVMVVGLGFLHRPSRAALLWSLAFVLAMASTWVSVAGSVMGEEAVRRAGLGLMLGAPALIWSGFRARRDARALPWIAVAQSVATAAAFVAATEPRAYGMTFRVAFLGAAVFAGLTIAETRRAADRMERLVLPLTIVSAGFVALAGGIVVAGLALPSNVGDLYLPRILNSLAMLVYLVCATVSVLYLTSVSPVGTSSAISWPQFTVTATDRLARARRSRETSWAVLAIRLDDPEQIRSTIGESGWNRIVSTFETVVARALPAEADLGRPARGRLVAVVCRPGPVLREHVRQLLRRVTEVDAADWVDVHFSASIGWVPAEAADYDLTELVRLAEDAAETASGLGGDRWERLRA